MKVFYASSAYRSFARTGRMNRALISRDRHELVSSPDNADVVILHCEPFKYPGVFERHPILRHKYVIACAAWEADPLPNLYCAGLALVQEVWTPSTFSKALFGRAHNNVHIIPHPISRDLSCRKEDFVKIDSLIHYSPRKRYYLSIARAVDKRKNILALIDAFTSTFVGSHEDVLIVKSDPGELSGRGESENLICVDACLTDSEINALYRRTFAYISVHHSEAWGLTISDALLFNIPIVATQWSGNLDYLSNASSFLIPSEVRSIEAGDCFGLFETSMKWAYPAHSEICTALDRVRNLTKDDRLQRCKHAACALERFSPERVSCTLSTRLGAIS